MARVLIVEDNADLATGIEYNLKLEGYDVRIADNGRAALDVAAEWPPDLILLDLMLPGLDGYQVLHSIRSNGNRAPVIILSAKGEEADKVRGFRLDADQYVTKPFGILELLERVAALLRRAAREASDGAPALLTFGDVVVDLGSRMITRRGTPVSVTPKAYELLLALVRRDGVVASRADLLKEVWGLWVVHHDAHRRFARGGVAPQARRRRCPAAHPDGVESRVSIRALSSLVVRCAAQLADGGNLARPTYLISRILTGVGFA